MTAQRNPAGTRPEFRLAPNYREHFVEGVIGNSNEPQRLVKLVFYSDAPRLPGELEEAQQQRTPDGMVTADVSRTLKMASVALVLSNEAARDVCQVLQSIIGDLEKGVRQ